MKRSKSKFLVSLEYYPLRGFLGLLGILPWQLSFWVSHVFVRGLLALLRKRRKIIDDNIALALPGQDPRDSERIAEASLLNLSRSITVFAKIPRLSPSEWTDFIRLEGLEHVEAALARGRGAIAFTAHYGCWEAMAAYLPCFMPSAIVVRPMDNPRLEALMTRARTIGGGRIILRERALSEGLRTLRRNQVLGILVDQNFASGNLFVNFMGRPAATTPIVSLLARRTGCSVLPLHTTWDEDRIRIIFEPALTLSRASDRSLAVAQDTQMMTRVVESWIRQDPGPWFWMHRRWKRQPQPGEFIYDPFQMPLPSEAQRDLGASPAN